MDAATNTEPKQPGLIEIIDSQIYLIQCLEEMFAEGDAPYEDWLADREKNVVRAMAVIFEAQGKLKAQVKGL